jgi:hypothetical protein
VFLRLLTAIVNVTKIVVHLSSVILCVCVSECERVCVCEETDSPAKRTKLILFGLATIPAFRGCILKLRGLVA